ncbi:hypothetical protein HMI54_014236 [Coelomomyces lativittatus]|nr:hypothetical protein HMI54_014236 [Coelomomyces lativittatus]
MDLLSKTPKFPWSGAVPTSKPSTTTTSTNTSQHLQPNPLPNPTNHPNVTASSTPVPGPASPVLQTCSKEKVM